MGTSSRARTSPQRKSAPVAQSEQAVAVLARAKSCDVTTYYKKHDCVELVEIFRMPLLSAGPAYVLAGNPIKPNLVTLEGRSYKTNINTMMYKATKPRI